MAQMDVIRHSLRFQVLQRFHLQSIETAACISDGRGCEGSASCVCRICVTCREVRDWTAQVTIDQWIQWPFPCGSDDAWKFFMRTVVWDGLRSRLLAKGVVRWGPPVTSPWASTLLFLFFLLELLVVHQY